MPVRTRVVVLLHRNELWKTSNTGRLAVRALGGAELRIRGDVQAPAPAPAPHGPRRVLFPVEGARVLAARDAGCVLVVPDGTWTQARRMARRDALVTDAEPVMLPPGPPSRYRLRRTEREGGLCTIEALSRALGVMEGPEVEAHLEAIFEIFVKRVRELRSLRD
jgi:DTW domain-containing protein YfiP